MISKHQFTGVKDEWHVFIALREHSVFIETVSDQSMEHYQVDMTAEKIQEDKHLAFLFANFEDLYIFLQSSFSDLVVKRGEVSITVDMPLGKITRKMELKIETHRKEVDQSVLRDLKIRKLQAELQELKIENNRLTGCVKDNQQQIDILRESMKRFQKTLEQKDEVINSIFAQLKEIRLWKEEMETRQIQNMKRKFSADTINPHNHKFLQLGNKYKKAGGGSWDLLICQNPIEINDVFRYTIRQIRAGSGGSFMYGIGTAAIRGVNRAQDHKEFIGYYENTGNIYDRGESRKGGPRIKDGDIVTIDVDTRNWTISWSIEGNKEAEITINGQLRVKPIFLALVIYNDEAQIQFV